MALAKHKERETAGFKAPPETPDRKHHRETETKGNHDQLTWMRALRLGRQSYIMVSDITNDVGTP